MTHEDDNYDVVHVYCADCGDSIGPFDAGIVDMLSGLFYCGKCWEQNKRANDPAKEAWRDKPLNQRKED